MLRSAALLLAVTATVAAADSNEYAIKATYLYKFAPFVDWPSASPLRASAEFDICLIGEDPFGPVIDEAVAHQTVFDRPIMVKRLGRNDEPAGCQILFIGDPGLVRRAVSDVEGTPVLTVADGADAESGAIINFVVENNRVRFDVDDAAAAENGLIVSSKLLSLARSVRPRARG